MAQTGRLVVRSYHPEDALALFEAVDGDRASLLPWLPWARDGNRTVEICRERIHEWTARAGHARADDFVLAIFDRTSGELVGGTGLHRIDADAACAEIGYWVRSTRRREGLCREAVAGLITAAFRDWGLRRIKICCAAGNHGSVAVIERLRLRLEARERAERFIAGHGYLDSLTYAVLQGEWDPERERGPGGTSLDA